MFVFAPRVLHQMSDFVSLNDEQDAITSHPSRHTASSSAYSKDEDGFSTVNTHHDTHPSTNTTSSAIANLPTSTTFHTSQSYITASSTRHSHSASSLEVSSAASSSSSHSTSASFFSRRCGVFYRTSLSSLGLMRQDESDIYRVHIRFSAILQSLVCLFYLMALWGFQKYFHFSGVTALMALCSIYVFFIFLLGIYSSQFVVFELADHELYDDSQAINTNTPSSSRQSSHNILLTPDSFSSYRRHLFALKCYRYGQLHPLSVLAFFLAVFLWSSMFNVSFMNYYTNLDFSSRSQTTCIILLTLNSLFALTVQAYSFFVSHSGISELETALETTFKAEGDIEQEL